MSRITNKANRLPREICVAGISLKGLWPVGTIEQRMKDIRERMEYVYPFEPDLICLPETVNISWVDEETTLAQVAEDEDKHGPITEMIAELAKKHNCYITCPIITKKDGIFYNSSILLDRQGKTNGIFHKVHPVSTEIIPGQYFKTEGVKPGVIRSTVHDTDFGKVGMQICFDANWTDSWNYLKQDGAELVCFSSQGPFTYMLRNHAWYNRYAIVSATGEDAQIVDSTGDMVELDGEFSRWVCGTINLEKEIVQIWPQVLKFKDIQKKYGTKVGIKIYHEENWAVIESLDPSVKIKEVLKEYDVPTFDEQIAEATEIQKKYRI
jgi:beta-ureidopropionase